MFKLKNFFLLKSKRDIRFLIFSVFLLSTAFGCRSLPENLYTEDSNAYKADNRRPNGSESIEKSIMKKLREDPHLSVQDSDTEGAIFIVIRSGNLFDLESATLSPTFIEILDRIAAILVTNANRSCEIKAIGHTDAYGDLQYNLMFSKKRAKAVQSYLVSKGIDKMSITTEGRGSLEPIVNNATSQGRSVNRRVDLLIRLCADKESISN